MHADDYVREQAPVFDKDDVTIILELDELNPLHSVNISVTPEAQVDISNRTARLTIAYNIIYNVNIMVIHPCEQSSVTIFTKMYYYPGEHNNHHIAVYD
jgi:hypothetical protein